MVWESHISLRAEVRRLRQEIWSLTKMVGSLCKTSCSKEGRNTISNVLDAHTKYPCETSAEEPPKAELVCGINPAREGPSSVHSLIPNGFHGIAKGSSHDYPRARCPRYTIAPYDIPRHTGHFAWRIQRNVRTFLEKKRICIERVRLKEAEEESRRWGLLAKLRAIRDRIHGKRIIHQDDNDCRQFVAVLDTLVGKRIVESIQNRRTVMTRETFIEAYGSLHTTWLWSLVCSTYCGGTRDPISQSDECLDVVLELHTFLEA